jgi:hypothetical protein
MAEPVRVMIQMRPSPIMAVASFGPLSAAPHLSGITDLPGVKFDSNFSPVPVPATTAASAMFGITASKGSSYVVRASVDSDSLDEFCRKQKQILVSWDICGSQNPAHRRLSVRPGRHGS